ncbi:MAG: hypothetical protein IPH04_19830 [Saprospirales bacterium]|nr:hypothetical protein [Saprospirales bacterium]
MIGTINYIVTGTDANNCTNKDTVTLVIHPLPVVDAGENQTTCEDTNLQLVGSPKQHQRHGLLDRPSYLFLRCF